jgi:DNA invertase Pin-like site-specific DNA recombinase
MPETIQGKTTAVTFIRVRYLDPKRRIPDFAREQKMIDLRRTVCEKMADKLDTQIIREYIEYCGGHDSIDQRPTLQRMLHELDTLRDTTYLIISDSLTQLTRRADEMETILQKIDATGIRIITAPSLSEGEQRLFRLSLLIGTHYR